MRFIASKVIKKPALASIFFVFFNIIIAVFSLGGE